VKSTSAGTLEFYRLRDLVGRFVSSPLGRAELAKVEPHSDRAALEADHAETAEGIGYLRSASKPQAAQRGAAIRIDFNGLPELDATVNKLRIEGATLEPREMFDVFAFLDRSADARSVLNAVAERFPRLGARGAQIGEFRNLLRDLEGKINPDGSIADTASVALNRIRRDIERQKRHIHDSLERFMKAHQEEGVLQEDFITIRSERFVVPIIAGQHKKLKGVVHGASSSGHTLFVEPLETIDLNNDLVRLTEEEMREIHRILREMTERLRGYSDAIRSTLTVMSRLELVFSKARFAIEFDCSIPRFCSEAERRLVVKKARHPLLQDVLRQRRLRVVPFSLQLDVNCRTLLISGPNTGGKTVTLKTLGLIALMAQAGIPVPCDDAELPVFEQILADIGDQQSIEANLSTFSAHMGHIREMALDVTPDSLVLMDELGSATDPEEGGALGVAIIDHFRASGAFTLASTHLLALKIYGSSTQSVLNASMGFDEETLEPTYELQTGLPGKSAGLDIAARLGMPDDIMRRARASMSDHERDLTRFIAELHDRIDQVRDQQTRLEKERAALAIREKQIADDWAKRESEKLKELERRCDALIARFENEARDTIARLQEGGGQRKAADRGDRTVAKLKRELAEHFDATVLETADDARQGELQSKRPKVEEGSRVRLKNIREPARVKRVTQDGRIEVEAGFMRMQVTIDDVLEVLPDAVGPSKLPKNVSYRPAPELNPVHQEINVIGQRAEEARDHVEQFLDRAVMATAARVRIVHGHGMGILKKVIWELLKSSPHVEKYYPAEQFEGGAGATIVELKD
jgi:DNA mismatch repair protein MutS2